MASGAVNREWRKKLSWRQDPADSFSDYTIHITRTSGSGRLDVYHAHRVVLGCSVHASGYFRNSFGQKGMIESVDKKTCMNLTDDEAGIFPFILDAMYGNLEVSISIIVDQDKSPSEKELEACRKAIAVLRLVDYLDIPQECLKVA